MGTTLTGTTPQDTYDSLIKVTDNGPLSGTAKYLSDGLGNDSVLALSTSRVGVGTATPSTTFHVSGQSELMRLQSTASFDNTIGFYEGSTLIGSIGRLSGGSQALGVITTTASDFILYTNSNERMRISAAGNVGIGTSSPDSTLHLNRIGAGVYNAVHYTNSNSTADFYVGIGGSSVPNVSLQNNAYVYNSAASAIVFATSDTERMRVLAGGGLTFNGDTAQANALDDYEEGTWTMGLSFGGGTTGITYNGNTGKYTKIGRQVTATGYIALTSKGSSGGVALLTGLPFTIASGDSSFSPANMWYIRVSFANQFEAYGGQGTNYIVLGELTEAGSFSQLTESDFQNNSELMVSITYFV